MRARVPGRARHRPGPALNEKISFGGICRARCARTDLAAHLITVIPLCCPSPLISHPLPSLHPRQSQGEALVASPIFVSISSSAMTR